MKNVCRSFHWKTLNSRHFNKAFFTFHVKRFLCFVLKYGAAWSFKSDNFNSRHKCTKGWRVENNQRQRNCPGKKYVSKVAHFGVFSRCIVVPSCIYINTERVLHAHFVCRCANMLFVCGDRCCPRADHQMDCIVH